jgi:hypothetical protein
METTIRADEISRVLKEQISQYNKKIEISETPSKTMTARTVERRVFTSGSQTVLQCGKRKFLKLVVR